jgi:prepilin-type N-terminal cleavage/methylation domain-containing protein
MRRGFTITELLVAVAIVVVVFLAIGKMFATAGRVTGLGEATTDVLQEAAAISRLWREDVEAVAPEGIFAIRCVAVRNDVNGAVLLNPNLPPDAVIRADQLLFFTNAAQRVRTFLAGSNANQRAQATVSRVYYGHAFQLGEAGLPIDMAGVPRAFDAGPLEPVTPWTAGQIETVRTIFSGFNIFRAQNRTETDVIPADARRWILTRQAVALMDDDVEVADSPDKAIFLDEALTARSIFIRDPLAGNTPQIRDGRIDAAATELNEIRRAIEIAPAGTMRPWHAAGGAGSGGDQFSFIADQMLYYPRAERVAPSANRIDQALTNHVLGTACSSIVIDWTYDDGTGAAFDASGTFYPGVRQMVDSNGDEIEQQWFGLSEARRGVVTYDEWADDGNGAARIFADQIERVQSDPDVVTYEAFFGFNRDDPFASGYTPWPSAIRVTLTLHDPRTELEAGREVQFVIKLPPLGP